ncbi:hypothetical protein NUW58_g940 [Xylaria curta]|uniref:Uncharacterized protein n=1 Tax=Xylaria curta TaxID=42375 RepID=A0ACC1PPF8_9PEZI|nr:hypothetical protein NUW58_g940 [Xylaria curta]
MIMEHLASRFGIHQTGPGAARILDQTLEKADLLGAFYVTIDAHQRAYQVMAANPSRLDPEPQQYLKEIKVIVNYENGDREITWVAKNTAKNTTRQLEFLFERVATALIPTINVWMDYSEIQIGSIVRSGVR